MKTMPRNSRFLRHPTRRVRKWLRKTILIQPELDSAYLRAKEQLESGHQQRIQSIRDQYGLSTQQERFNAELEQLRLAREQQFLTEEQYEQAVQNLKRDSYKSSLTIIPVCFPGPFKHCSKRKWTRSMQNMMRKLRQPKVIRKKWNVWKTKRPRESDTEKYADVNFAIKASQIIADTAVSIMKAYADLGPIAGSIAAAHGCDRSRTIGQCQS